MDRDATGQQGRCEKHCNKVLKREEFFHVFQLAIFLALWK